MLSTAFVSSSSFNGFVPVSREKFYTRHATYVRHPRTKWTMESESTSPKRIAVIGAGWAGLGAAHHLVQQSNTNVTLIDAAPSVGGLVAGWKTKNGQDVEVGIHGMWRPYFNLFHLVQRELKLNPFTDWTRSSQRSPKGKVVESPIFNDLPRLPSPLGTFVYTKFLDLPLADRLSALPLLEAVIQWDNSDEVWRKFDKMTAKELFKYYGCTERVYKEAFEPMLLVGLFAPGEQCSAAGALGMLYFFILAHQADFDVVWPRGTVGTLIFAPLVDRIRSFGGHVQTSTRLKDVVIDRNRVTKIVTTSNDGSESVMDVDAVVFSVGISGLQGILRNSKTLASRKEFRNTNNLSSIDVMAVRLYFDRKIHIEFDSNACFGFDESTGWTYFNLNAIHDEFKDAEKTVIEADFYHSNQLMPMDDAEIAEEVRRRLCVAESTFKGAEVEDYVVVRVPRGVTRTLHRSPCEASRSDGNGDSCTNDSPMIVSTRKCCIDRFSSWVISRLHGCANVD
ncbi:amine oxidase [Gracilaria domingensis]|nr:amine oxidase [Gracilaria domingensis]